MLISKLNDKFYKTYKILFNKQINKFYLINNYILYNYIYSNQKILCNIKFNKSNYEQLYYNITLKNTLLYISSFNFQNYIPVYNNENDYLIITNIGSIITNTYNNYKNIDCIYFYNYNRTNIIFELQSITTHKKNKNINSDLNLYLEKNLYLQFLNNLKNDINIKKKYKIITCHYGYIFGLSLSASYKMVLEIPNIISTISMALKYIENNGTLLLFWTIINVNITVVKQILSLLSYVFKDVEIIDKNINQNILIGVPEYYIKCTGYKNNIIDELINKLIDIAIKSVEYTYDKCDVLDYYENYTMKNPNHSLFYNKKDDKKDKINNNSLSSTKTSSLLSTKSSSTKSSSTKKAKQPVKQIYYIEDLELPEIDTIMKDKTIEFKVSNLSNKLETIFVSYFEMVNNLILNSIAKDKNGKLYVKPSAILQKDITNLTKLINMFEYNKLPYNKHALQVVLNKKDEVLEQFYSLDTQINYNLIHYTDKTSKTYNNRALDNIKSKTLQPYKFNILAEYYERITIANKVRQHLLDELNVKNDNQTDNTPQLNITDILYEFHDLYDFSKNLCHYINNNDNNDNNINSLPIYIGNSFLKLWEILSSFNLIPSNSKQFKIFHLAEPTGQMIICAKYWAEHKCSGLDMKNYDWLANTFNPYHKTSSSGNNSINNAQGDNYELIKNNYNRWLFGADNSGDITNVNNIKSIMNDIKNKWLARSDNSSNNSNKLDLIISDGNILSSNTDELVKQKFDLAKVISVIACSSIGGSCCIKHYIPYKLFNTNNNITSNKDNSDILEASGFFINYLYLYYVVFDIISLFKPNTSNADTTEFYVIGKGFNGIENSQLEKLFKLLDTFELNGNLIEHNKIPETFIMQINNFLKSMSDTNILSIEKQNLLLTCYKNESDEQHNRDGESNSKSKKYKRTNKILKCDKFLNPKNIKNIIEPKYKEWVKKFSFE